MVDLRESQGGDFWILCEFTQRNGWFRLSKIAEIIAIQAFQRFSASFERNGNLADFLGSHGRGCGQLAKNTPNC